MFFRTKKILSRDLSFVILIVMTLSRKGGLYD